MQSLSTKRLGRLFSLNLSFLSTDRETNQQLSTSYATLTTRLSGWLTAKKRKYFLCGVYNLFVQWLCFTILRLIPLFIHGSLPASPPSFALPSNSKKRMSPGNSELKHSKIDVGAWRNPLISEIWDMIAAFLSRNDLCELSLVSSRFSDIFRSILYRRLILDFTYRYTDMTLVLLCTNLSLAKSVRSFAMVAPQSGWGHSGLREAFPGIEKRFLMSIGNMTSLQEIEMDTSMFTCSEEEADFKALLVDHQIPLKSFSYGSGFDRYQLTRNVLVLSGLTSISWYLGHHTDDESCDPNSRC